MKGQGGVEEGSSSAVPTSNQQQPFNNNNNPYMIYSTPTNNPNYNNNNNNNNNNNTTTSPMDSILKTFNSWTKKAEITTTNIWHNLNTAPLSPYSAAWDKLNLNAKAALTAGGFDTLYKQTFSTFPYENLKKTFACHLSTTTGPVPGTLYLSDVHLSFCSDRPIPYTAPDTQITWSHYKVIVPLVKISAINPVVMRDESSERYLQVVTVDGHDFWFMGFVNFEKAARYISESLGSFLAPGVPLQPAP